MKSDLLDKMMEVCCCRIVPTKEPHTRARGIFDGLVGEFRVGDEPPLVQLFSVAKVETRGKQIVKPCFYIQNDLDIGLVGEVVVVFRFSHQKFGIVPSNKVYFVVHAFPQDSLVEKY